MSREVTMTNTPEWFLEMADAIRRRDHALKMITRWQGTLAETEATISALASGQQANADQATEPVQE
jgi:hypothetical protein